MTVSRLPTAALSLKQVNVNNSGRNMCMVTCAQVSKYSNRTDGVSVTVLACWLTLYLYTVVGRVNQNVAQVKVKVT